MEIADRIKILRKQQGLTLEEVGNRVGVGKSTVRKWESGQIANMRRDKIALLAAALGVSPSTLMGWDENEDVKNPAPASVAEPERDEIAKLFASLSEENQQRLLDFAKVLLVAQQAEHDSQG